MWTNHSWPGGMWIFPVIMAVIVILLILFFRRDGYTFPWYKQNEQNETASEILKKRYAKGEISKDQYETMKNSIQ